MPTQKCIIKPNPNPNHPNPRNYLDLLFYSAIIATTATIAANTLPFITRSCVPPSLSAPLLDDELELELELPSPCENPLEPLVAAAPLPESVPVAVDTDDIDDAELESPELPEWLSVPGPEPVRPGTV